MALKICGETQSLNTIKVLNIKSKQKRDERKFR